MEQKVDLMFQLIQEYEQNKIIQSYPQDENIPSSNDQATYDQATHDQSTHDPAHLISVSDDDEEYSDSDEVSDEEDEGLLNIKEIVSGENIKSISLSGAEIESLQVADDLDDISDLEDTHIDDIVNLAEVNNDEIEVSLEDDNEENITDQEETEEVTVKKIDVDKSLDQLSVKELKILAEEKGFTNYKGLRKNKLVELLATSQ